MFGARRNAFRPASWGALVTLIILVVFPITAFADFSWTTHITVRNTSVSEWVQYECLIWQAPQKQWISLGRLWAAPEKEVTFTANYAVGKSTNYWIELRETPQGRDPRVYAWQEIEWQSRKTVTPYSTPGMGSGSHTDHFLSVKALPIR